MIDQPIRMHSEILGRPIVLVAGKQHLDRARQDCPEDTIYFPVEVLLLEKLASRGGPSRDLLGAVDLTKRELGSWVVATGEVPSAEDEAQDSRAGLSGVSSTMREFNLRKCREIWRLALEGMRLKIGRLKDGQLPEGLEGDLPVERDIGRAIRDGDLRKTEELIEAWKVEVESLIDPERS